MPAPVNDLQAQTPPSALDTLLPAFTFRHAHAIWIHSGDMERIMAIVRDLPMQKSPWLSLLFRLRGLPSPKQGGRSFVRSMGWTDLSGGAPWEMVVAYAVGATTRPLPDADAFKSSTARRKVAFGFRVRRVASDIVELSTETRVLCTSAEEQRRFRWYWTLIRPFSGWIRHALLRLVRSTAEAEWHADPAHARKIPDVVATLPVSRRIALQAFFRLAGHLCPPLAVQLLGRSMVRPARRPTRPAEAGFLSGGQARQLAFGKGFLMAHAFGEGPTVVLVHGLLGHAADFRTLIPAITRCGFRALAIHWTNHGGSPAGPVLSRHAISGLAALFDSVEDLHAVVAHSAGAYFSLMALASTHPRPRRPVGVFLSTPIGIQQSVRAAMHYLNVPRGLYCDLCRWFERELQTPLSTLDLSQDQTRVACHQGSRALLMVHDPLDRYAPFDALRDFAGADRRVTVLSLTGVGHFKLLHNVEVVESTLRCLLHGENLARGRP